MEQSKIYVFGDGPSGLISANYLKLISEHNFQVCTTKDDGFASNCTEGFKYKIAQRTMFWNKNLEEFYSKIFDNPVEIKSLENQVGVYFRGKIHSYPMQNNLSGLNWKDKLRFYWSYFNRKKTDNSDYYSWAISNYGHWFANNILIPHTWKALREDLQQIDSSSYGKKVVPLKFWSKNKILEFVNSDFIIHKLRSNISDYIIPNTEIIQIDLKNKSFKIKGYREEIPYSVIFNTISLPKLYNLIKRGNDNYQVENILDVAFNSLQWNNMFVSVFIIPKNLINNSYNGFKILYFPEKDYIYSKVNINRGESNSEFGIIVCETSFRRNDIDKFNCKAYRDKIMDRIESDLKRSGVISDVLLTIYQKDYRIISPAYIITDNDYSASNDFIQSHLQRYGVYNVGRFSQWVPNMRIEHSLDRINKLYVGGCFDNISR